MTSFLDLHINLGASAKECRNKRLHLLNASVPEFKHVGGLIMRRNSATITKHKI